MEDKAKEIISKFTPEHISQQIPKSTEDLKEEVQKAKEQVEEPEEKPEKPDEKLKMEKEYTFDFDWTNPRGKRYKGKFTNRILTIGERQDVGLARARLTGGLPIDSFDAVTREINLIIAHLTFSLVKRPEWAQDLAQLHEVNLLQEIYMEVASHEAIFSGRKPFEKGSNE